MIAFVKRVASRLRGIRVALTAASLAFTTMLALVPLATVTFVVVARVPLFEDGMLVFEDWIVRVLMPMFVFMTVVMSMVMFVGVIVLMSVIMFVAVTAIVFVFTFFAHGFIPLQRIRLIFA